jgi:hypothetical protein
MHGAESGHLLVYCDSNIILIDFSVLEDKTYTFFIDEQLCEISIEKHNGQFLYGFEINKRADTPRNRLRKKIERKHFKQSLLFLAGIISVVVAVTYFMVRQRNAPLTSTYERQLERGGKEVEAKILKVSPSEVTYFYIVNGTSYSGEIKAEDGSIVVLENGMPLEEGDEFVVTYVPVNPTLNEIDYNRPTKKQVALYRKRAIKQHLNLNPKTDSSRVACLVDVAYDIKGIKGLADIYFQQATPNDNPRNNVNTFNRLFRDIPFQKKVDELCWN